MAKAKKEETKVLVEGSKAMFRGHEVVIDKVREDGWVEVSAAPRLFAVVEANELTLL